MVEMAGEIKEAGKIVGSHRCWSNPIFAHIPQKMAGQKIVLLLYPPFLEKILPFLRKQPKPALQAAGLCKLFYL